VLLSSTLTREERFYRFRKMLCDVCWFMLRGHERLVWRGTYDLDFRHHETAEALRKSAELKCSICRTLQDILEAGLSPAEISAIESLVITARLSLQNRDPRNTLYRLDFRLQGDALEKKRTFILKEIGWLILDPVEEIALIATS
jgi:hypothetical protein